jgi:hypothetical protein
MTKKDGFPRTRRDLNRHMNLRRKKLVGKDVRQYTKRSKLQRVQIEFSDIIRKSGAMWDRDIIEIEISGVRAILKHGDDRKFEGDNLLISGNSDPENISGLISYDPAVKIEVGVSYYGLRLGRWTCT